MVKNTVFLDVTPCGSYKNRKDVSEELSASFIRVTGMGELETTQSVTSNRRTPRRNTMMKESVISSEMAVLLRATCRNIPEGTIIQIKLGFFIENNNLQEKESVVLQGSLCCVLILYYYSVIISSKLNFHKSSNCI
jgi:hypothetical protein